MSSHVTTKRGNVGERSSFLAVVVQFRKLSFNRSFSNYDVIEDPLSGLHLRLLGGRQDTKVERVAYKKRNEIKLI